MGISIQSLLFWSSKVKFVECQVQLANICLENHKLSFTFEIYNEEIHLEDVDV